MQVIYIHINLFIIFAVLLTLLIVSRNLGRCKLKWGCVANNEGAFDMLIFIIRSFRCFYQLFQYALSKCAVTVNKSGKKIKINGIRSKELLLF